MLLWLGNATWRRKPRPKRGGRAAVTWVYGSQLNSLQVDYNYGC